MLDSKKVTSQVIMEPKECNQGKIKAYSQQELNIKIS